MNDREQFIKDFVQAGKQRGASKQEVAAKLDLALAEYDQTQSGGSGNLISQIADVGKAVFPQSTKFIQNIAEYPETFRKAWDPNNPNRGEFAVQKSKEMLDQTKKTQLEAAPWLIPATGSLKTMIATGGVAGGLGAASRDGATPLDIAGGVAAGAGTAGVLKGAGSAVGKGAGSAVGKGAESVGKFLKGQGEQLVLRALKPSKTQLTNFRKTTGKDLADFLNEQGITGDFATKAQEKIDTTLEAFDDLAVHSGAKVQPGKLDELFIKRIQAMKNSVVPEVKQKAQALQEILDNTKAKYGDGPVDVGDLTRERRALDDLLKDSQFNLPIEQSSYLRSARDAYQEVIQEATKGLGSKDLKTLGLELRDLFEFKKIADAQGDAGRGANPLGMLSTLGAGFGGVTAGVPGMLAGIGATKAMQSPRVVGAGSRAMQSAGGAIQDLPKVADRMEPLKRALRNVTTQQMSQMRLP